MLRFELPGHHVISNAIIRLLCGPLQRLQRRLHPALGLIRCSLHLLLDLQIRHSALIDRLVLIRVIMHRPSAILKRLAAAQVCRHDRERIHILTRTGRLFRVHLLSLLTRRHIQRERQFHKTTAGTDSISEQLTDILLRHGIQRIIIRHTEHIPFLAVMRLITETHLARLGHIVTERIQILTHVDRGIVVRFENLLHQMSCALRTQHPGLLRRNLTALALLHIIIIIPLGMIFSRMMRDRHRHEADTTLMHRAIRQLQRLRILHRMLGACSIETAHSRIRSLHDIQIRIVTEQLDCQVKTLLLGFTKVHLRIDNAGNNTLVTRHIADLVARHQRTNLALITDNAVPLSKRLADDSTVIERQALQRQLRHTDTLRRIAVSIQFSTGTRHTGRCHVV